MFRHLRHILPQISDNASGVADKRKAGRLLVTGLGSGKGRLVDISVQGARIRTRQAWAIGETRELTLNDSKRSVKVVATCIWTRPWRGKEIELGLSFDELSPEDRAALTAITMSFIASLTDLGAA